MDLSEHPKLRTPVLVIASDCLRTLDMTQGGEREGEGWKERVGQRDRKIQRNKERERERERERETETERQRETERDRDRDRERQRERGGGGQKSRGQEMDGGGGIRGVKMGMLL